MKLLFTGFPQQQRYGIFLQRIFLMRFSIPFLTGLSGNKTPLCGISPYVFSFFFLRGSLSFRRWFSHPFISRISCFPLWDFSALPLRFFPSLSPAEFLPSVMQQKNSRSCPGVFSREMTLSFSRTHSSDPDRRSSHRNPNRTYNSPSRKPKADR